MADKVITTKTCPRCNGSGTIEVPAHGSWEEWGTIYAECPRCHGLGWEKIDKSYSVEYTPGPPAVGVLTRKVVEAKDADDANAQIRRLHPDWCMIHRTELVESND